MTRKDQYVTVTAREWAIYNREPARSVAKRLLHAMIFYGSRPVRTIYTADTYMRNGRTVIDVLHPLPAGRIPEGHAVTEPEYQNETRWTVRSERETQHTISNATERAL